jgi:hypothetical protein
MRQRRAARRIDVGADVRFGDEVADHVIGKGLGQREVDDRRGQAIEGIVGEGLAQAGIGIGADDFAMAGYSDARPPRASGDALGSAVPAELRTG